MDGLQRLIYLCQIKNDLNRKRRRFYYITYKPGSKVPFGMTHSEWMHYKSNGYEQAKKDMKAMTRDMRKMRVDCGVRFIWNDGGLIEAIELGSGRRIKQTTFKKYYEAEVFEMELFGGK